MVRSTLFELLFAPEQSLPLQPKLYPVDTIVVEAIPAALYVFTTSIFSQALPPTGMKKLKSYGFPTLPVIVMLEDAWA